MKYSLHAKAWSIFYGEILHNSKGITFGYNPIR